MLTYTIIQFVQHLEAVQIEFRHDDLPTAYTRMTIKLPVENGQYLSGNTLDAFIRERAPDRAWFETQEAALTATKPELTALPIELAEVVPVEKVIRPTEWYQTTQIGAPVLRNGLWIRPIEVVDLPNDTDINDLRKLLLNEIANKRFQIETQGILVNGSLIKTDRESQATITSAWSVAKQNPNTVIDWKASDGWVQLDATTMIAIGDAVFAHVQGCFSRERQLSDQIALATTLAELRAIDYEGGW